MPTIEVLNPKLFREMLPDGMAAPIPIEKDEGIWYRVEDAAPLERLIRDHIVEVHDPMGGETGRIVYEVIDHAKYETCLDEALHDGMVIASDVVSADGKHSAPAHEWVRAAEGVKIVSDPRPKLSQPEAVGDVDDYFIEKTFIAKILGDKIMSRHAFKTMKDTGEIFVYDGGIYIGKAITAIEAEAQKALDYKSTSHRVKEVVGYIQRATYVDREDFDTDKNIINLENGLFDFETMAIKPHTPEYLSLHKSPIHYDQAATCPRTDQFFDEILLKKDVILMYELFGYALVKDKRMSEAIILEGATGDNGKSTMIDLLNAFVGEAATSHITPNELSDDTYAAAGLFGRLLNTIDDLGNTPLTRLGVFKSVVACKPIRAHNKFEREFNFKPDALCVFAVNDVPITTDTSDAFFKRMVIIPFLQVYRGKDENGKDKANKHLIDELTAKDAISGLFNVAIAAAKGAIEAGKFTGVGTVMEKREAYTYASNSVAQFIDDECTFDDLDDYVSSKELHHQYVLWARDRGLKVRDHGSMTTYLKELGITTGQPVGDDGMRHKSYMGIRMKVVI